MVQLPMMLTMEANTKQIVQALIESKRMGCEVAVFPESTVTGYHPEMGKEISRSTVQAALGEIASQCAALEISAIVGAPFYSSDEQVKPWNAAVVIDAKGHFTAVFPKIIFTEDEILNDIYEPGTRQSRTSFELNGVICGILICIEYAGMVGDFTSDYCYEFLSAMSPPPSVVFVIGVMNMGPDSNAPALAQEAAAKYGAHFVVVNASDWGFGTPTGSLGGSLVSDPSGNIICLAPWNEHCVTLASI